MPVEKLIPLLVCRDIQATHDFLVSAFGFRSGGVQFAGGNAVHGEVHLGGETIWLHRETAQYELASPLDLKVAHAGLVVHVPDVDAHYAHARAAGARIDSEPADQSYGQREYGARDPEGHRFWFATPKG